MASRGVKAYRDHFIHSFQDFLTGIMIIDRYYDHYVRLYSNELNEAIGTSLECAWLLTAIFHDRYKGLLKIIESLGGQLEPPERKPEYNIYANNLASIYQHIRDGKPLGSWRSVPTRGDFSSRMRRRRRWRRGRLRRRPCAASPARSFLPRRLLPSCRWVNSFSPSGTGAPRGRVRLNDGGAGPDDASRSGHGSILLAVFAEFAREPLLG